jgi:hypothetical protein
MQIRMTPFVWTLVGIASVAMPSRADAVPAFVTRVGLHAAARTPPYDPDHRKEQTTDTGPMPVASIPQRDISLQVAGGDGNATAEVTAGAQLGKLQGLAAVSVSNSSLSGGSFAGGDSGPGEQWADLFHVTSDTLASGTQVKLRLTLTLNDSLQASDASLAAASASASVNGLRIDDSTAAPAAQHAVSVDLCEHVGDAFFLQAGLSFSATSRGGTAVADVSNGAIVMLQMLTPGANYVAASSQTYGGAPASVPEPGELAGLLAVFSLRRRRRALHRISSVQ